MSTRAEGWYIDGEHLDAYATIGDRDGWDDTPPLRGDNLVLLGRHGEVRRRKRYGPGKKTLNLTVQGVGADGWSVPATGREQRALYEQNLDSIYRLLAPGSWRALSVERVHANGDRRQADCEVVSPITPATFGDTVGQFSIELNVPGSFWTDVDATSQRLAYDAVAGGAQTMELYSLAGQTAPCADPVVVVTGPCSSVAVHDAATGSGWTYPATVGLGQHLTVDAGAFTALLDSSSVVNDLVLAGQEVLELVPAPSIAAGPSVTVTAAGTSAGFAVVFTTRRKWLR